jgi:hypothetical protein
MPLSITDDFLESIGISAVLSQENKRAALQQKLAKLAAQNGSSNDQEKPENRYTAIANALRDIEELRTMTPPEPIIDGYLFKDSLAWLGGKPGHAKSFVAVELACCVATGTPWHSHQVTQGRAFYLVAEGASGLSIRLDAWEIEHDTQIPKEAMSFLPMPVQLMDEVDVLAFERLLGECAPLLVILDTQARVSVGAEENSARDMGRLVEALEHLRRRTGACILVVHHEPRTGDHLRGSIALEGAATTILRSVKEGDLVTVSNPKQKDSAAMEDMPLTLEQRDQSAVLVRLNPGSHKLTPGELQTLKALQDFTEEWVAKGAVKATCLLPEATFYRALNSLIRKGFVEQRGKTQKQLRYVPDQDRLV